MRDFSRLAIRLARHGCANRPFYHIVVMKKHKGQHKTPIDQLGTFDPMPNRHNELAVSLNYERIKHYIGMGAEPTQVVSKLFGLSGFYPIHPNSYINADRKRAKLLTESLAQEAAAEEAAQAEEESTESSEDNKST